jgi:uncharacterized protein
MSRPSRAATRLLGIVATTLLFAAPAPAAEADELYVAQAIVTGTGEVNRRLGLSLCLEDVLVKVSGDPRLIGDPRVVALAKQANTLVAKFTYRDRFAHRPINDEQGTRDRPHDLTVTFVRAKIDAALATLGRKPWTGTRPKLVVFLGVNNGAVTYALAGDGERGREQRESLGEAAKKLGFAMAVPNTAALDAAGASYESLETLDPAKLEAAAKAAGGELPLLGRLTWSDKALGWIADWRIAAGGKTYRWQIRGVSFDDAFRNGMRGAAQVLSGNGQPR